MAAQKTQGFTIIEVILVLAISGFLTISILVGSGVTIGQQRYKDSVNSLKAFIQQQYSEAANVTNDRSGVESCANAIVTAPPATVTTPDPRGTSDCLVVGRLVVINPAGEEVTASNIIGYHDPTAPTESTDIDELAHYQLQVSPLNQEVKSVDWSAKVVQPATGTPQPVTMMIIRSPLSGSIMTFVRPDSDSGNLDDLVAAGIDYPASILCVQGAAGTFVGSLLAVRINPHATSPSGIEIPSESENVCN